MNSNNSKRRGRATWFTLAVVVIIGAAGFWLAGEPTRATETVNPTSRMYRRPAPNFDLNASRALERTPRGGGDHSSAIKS